MASTREIYVVAAARTAIGTFGGALKDVPLTQLATTAVREALKRSGAEAGDDRPCRDGQRDPDRHRATPTSRASPRSRPASRTRRRR